MKKTFTLLVILTVFLASCQKFDSVVDEDLSIKNTDIQTVSNPTDMSSLVISDSFDWKLIKTLNVEINLPGEGERQITKILSLDRNTMYFNGYPEDDSNILKTKVTFPTYVENVLIEYGNGVAGKVVSVGKDKTTLATALEITMLKDAWAPHTTPSQSIYASTPPVCDVTLTGNVGDIEIDDDLVYCIQEGTTVNADDIKFRGDGGTLYVKGKLNVDQINVQGNSTGYIFVSATGEIDADQIFLNKMKELINYGTVSSDGEPAIDADMLFENFGTFNSDGIVNNSEDFLNAGTLNVDGQFNNTGIGINDGTIIVTGSNGHFNNTGNPSIEFYNYCKIYVEQNFTQNSKFYHYGYLEVDKKSIISGSGNTFMVMGQYSLVVTEDLQITGEVQGPNESGAKFKVADETRLTGAADISGYIQFCDADGTIEVNNGTLGPNVDFGCDLVIPENDCNPGDEPPVGPPDPDPETFTGTLAYEDLWPGKGDYDVNDLVVEYDFEISKNSQERIEHITASFLIRAFGATLHNGFGFTFPNVEPSDIVSVTGYDIASGAVYNMAANGTENGQSAATFIVVDDPYRVMPYPGSGIGVNTDPFATYVTPVTLVLEIEFADNAVTYSQLDIGNFNPFIVKNQVRGMEIHLPDYPPTDLHDASNFGTFEDDSNPPSKYYLTANNLPWAIQIPERFDYPVEKQIILGAYSHFAEWAQSDGVLYPDWYKDLPGYRNASVIY